jgi:hypothetical protein
MKKIIMSQVYVEANLPTIFEKVCRNEFGSLSEAREQIKRVVQVVQLDDAGLSVIEGADELLANYHQLPNLLQAHLDPLVQQTRTSLQSSPIQLEQCPKKQPVQFSSQFKAPNIKLDDTQLKMTVGNLEENFDVQFVAIDNLAGDLREVSLKIHNAEDGMVYLGVFNREALEKKAFRMPESMIREHSILLKGINQIPEADSGDLELFIDYGCVVKI